MERPWPWSVHISSFIGQSPESILETCQRAGLTAVDGTYRFFQNHTARDLDAFAQLFAQGGVRIETFHLPFTEADEVTSFYETIRTGAVKRICHWMEMAKRLGASVGILHPIKQPYNVDIEGLDKYLTQLGKSLETLLPTAEDIGFSLAIENLPPGQGRFGSRPEHFTEIASRFAHPNLGFCLDTGHALVAVGLDHANDFLDVMGPNLIAFHLTDNAGDRDAHLAPGHGLVDWGPVFRKAVEIGFSRPMCIETPPFAPGPRYSPDAWKQMLDDTDALVVQALAKG
ncbi:TPA: hypothetical protein DCE37_26480 [Candidatus Latescibacteria bacterium]|nr:hypothetical protein [Candidatus Latescibacterota bacterium]